MGSETEIHDYSGSAGWQGELAYLVVALLYLVFILAGALALVGAVVISAILLGFDGVIARLGFRTRRSGLPAWQKF